MSKKSKMHYDEGEDFFPSINGFNYSRRWEEHWENSFLHVPWKKRKNAIVEHENEIVNVVDKRMYDKFVENKVVDKIEVKGNTDYISEFMIRDIFKQFYIPNDNLNYNINKDMSWWFNVLNKLDNYMMKIITNDSEAKSYLTTLSIIEHLQQLFGNQENAIPNSMKKFIDEMNREENKKNEDIKNSLSGQGDGNDKGKSGAGKSNYSNSSLTPEEKIEYDKFKNSLDKAVKNALDAADKKIQQHQELAGLLEKSSEEAGTVDGAEQLMEMNSLLGNVSFSKKSIEDFVKKTCKGITKSFKNNIKLEEDSLLDADEIEEIEDLHLLPFQELIDDMSVKKSSGTFSFDLYVDISGSMGSPLPLKGGEFIQRISLAKILAFKMDKMGILNNFYTFKANPSGKIKRENILSISSGGGTCINNSLVQINNNNIPSLVITDGDDTVGVLCENAYILSIGNGLIHFSSEEAVNYYVNSKKLMLFNNNKFFPAKKSNDSRKVYY